MKRRITLLLAVLLFCLLQSIQSEANTFIKEYTYQASEIDSKVSCRAIALEQVKRLLLEELGVYLESQTEVKNFKLSSDLIIVLTAGITRTEIINESFDGKTYWLKAKLEADPEETVKALASLRKDRQRAKDLETIRKKTDAALKENEGLKKELELAKADQAIITRYNKTIKELNAANWFENGLSFASAGKHPEAIDAYTKAVELEPNNPYIYNNLGLAYLSLGKNEQALESYTKAIKLIPDISIFYNGRGIAFGQLRRYEEAAKDFRQAIEIDPGGAITYRNRGLLYELKGQNTLAFNDYNKAIELDPENDEGYAGRGKMHAAMGNFDLALQDIEKAIQLNPKSAKAYGDRGITYINLGKFDLALKDLNKAIELDFKANWYYNRGIAYLNLGNYDLGKKDCEKALDLDPNFPQAHSTLGQIYFKILNNNELALKYYSRAIELNATYAPNYVDRARVYLRLSDNKKAFEDLKVAARLGDKKIQGILKEQGIAW